MVGEAGTAESAVSMIRALWADVAVLDVRPPIRTPAADPRPRIGSNQASSRESSVPLSIN
jgi:hypothetical protein